MSGAVEAPAPDPRAARACVCGGRPQWTPAGSAYGNPVEVLACFGCGRSAGPLHSRHEIAADWNDYAWREPPRGEARP